MRLRAPGSDNEDGPQPPAGRSGPITAIFRHNDARFACAACADSFRHYGELVAHRRSVHRSSIFEDWFDAACQCSALFAHRLDALTHAGRCNARAPPTQPPRTTSNETLRQESHADAPTCAASVTRAHVDSASPPLAPPPPQQGAYPRHCSRCPAFLTDARSWNHHDRVCAAAAASSNDQRQQQQATNPLQPTDAPSTTPSRATAPANTNPRNAYRTESPAANHPPLRSTAQNSDDAQAATESANEDVEMLAAIDEFLQQHATAYDHAQHIQVNTAQRNNDDQANSAQATIDVTMHPDDDDDEFFDAITAIDDNFSMHSDTDIDADMDAADQHDANPSSRTHDQARANTSATATQDSTRPFGGSTQTPWCLRFDGACRRNPGPAGAGAALFKPDGPVFWTSSRYIADPKATNNTAEYSALLDGLLSARHHGVQHLRIEGDSALVIEQVKGKFSCSADLRPMRDLAFETCQSFESYSLRHIDRFANAHADRLANRAYDRRTTTVCALHAAPDDKHLCWHWQPSISTTTTATTTIDNPEATSDDDNTAMDVTANEGDDPITINATRDGGIAYPVLQIGPGCVPARQQRVRIPRLPHHQLAQLEKQLQRVAGTMASKITDAPDWFSTEGYITAATDAIAECIRRADPEASERARTANDMYEQTAARTGRGHSRTDSTVPAADATRQVKHTRRGGNKRRGISSLIQQALVNAREELANTRRLAATHSQAPRKDVGKAARRVKRIEKAIARHTVRHQFMTQERKVVQSIIRTESTSSRSSPSGQSTTPVTTSAATPTTVRASTATHAARPRTVPAPAPAAADNRCPIPAADLFAFFQTQATAPSHFAFDATDGRPFRAALAKLPRAEKDAELLQRPITSSEIEDQLERVHTHSAPGLDGVTYAVYVRFKLQLAPLLHAIMNACWQHQRVPSTWKVGWVELVPKKGDPTNPSSWRPICLQQTVYKIYAGILATRFQQWMDANERLTLSQKGFRSFNGCHEHNFVASTLVEQARRTKKKLYVVWYDLRNAFGAVPQAYMCEVLRRLGVPSHFVQVARDIYTDSHFVVNSRDGPTDPVRLERGVYQGCPLSPYLFIAALSPLMHVLHEAKHEHGVSLAAGVWECNSSFADDLKIFSRSADGVQHLHNTVLAFLKWTHMSANPSKCAYMISDGAAQAGGDIESLSLQIDGTPVPQLTGSEGYTYLGIEDGPDHTRTRVNMQKLLKNLSSDAVLLLQSNLAPWQIIKAIKCYVLSRLDYPLRHMRPFISMVDGFDKTLLRGLKRLLRLPQTATTELFYSPTSAGGFGLLPLREYIGATKITHALQMLHSKDATIRAIARSQLMTVVRKRYTLNEPHWLDQDELVAQLFLNGELGDSPHALKKKISGDVHSLWVDAASYMKTFGLKLVTIDGEHLHLRVPHTDKPLAYNDWAKQIKLHLKLRHLERWRNMQDQGKTVRLHGGAGSAFLTRASGVHDASYRFAIRARLNQVDTRSALKRKHVVKSNRCRAPGCQDTETLAHVLHHCTFDADSIRVRHDESLAIISARVQHEATRGGRTHLRLLTDSEVPGLADANSDDRSLALQRPDIQLYDDVTMTAVIIDLAIAFEDQATDDAERSSNFTRVRQIKVGKYENVRRFLVYRGYTVHVAALVYGSLGAVCTSNLAVLTDHLGVRKAAARTLERQLSARHINFGLKIWKRHAIADTNTRLLNKSASQASTSATQRTTRINSSSPRSRNAHDRTQGLGRIAHVNERNRSNRSEQKHPSSRAPHDSAAATTASTFNGNVTRHRTDKSSGTRQKRSNAAATTAATATSAQRSPRRAANGNSSNANTRQRKQQSSAARTNRSGGDTTNTSSTSQTAAAKAISSNASISRRNNSSTNGPAAVCDNGPIRHSRWAPSTTVSARGSANSNSTRALATVQSSNAPRPRPAQRAATEQTHRATAQVVSNSNNNSEKQARASSRAVDPAAVRHNNAARSRPAGSPAVHPQQQQVAQRVRNANSAHTDSHSNTSQHAPRRTTTRWGPRINGATTHVPRRTTTRWGPRINGATTHVPSGSAQVALGGQK